MSRNLQTTFGVVAAALVLLVGFFIFVLSTAKATAHCSFPSGRTVNVTSSWGAGMSNTSDTVDINVAGHTVIVAPLQISVDGQRVAKIDPSVKQIEVIASRNEIKFVGDGQPLAEWYR